MLEKKELSSLLITTISVKMLLTYPMLLVKNSANAAWIQVLFVTGAALLLFYLMTKVYEKKIGVIELSGIRMGKAARIIVGLVVFAILFLNLARVMRVFPESVKTVSLQDTSTELIIGVLALIVFLCVRYGIEAIATINYIILPVCGILLVAFPFLLAPYYKMDNLFPFFGNGIFKVFVSGTNGLSLFADMLILNVLLNYSKNIKEARSCGFRAILISGIAAALIILLYGLVFPYPSSEKFIFPVYQMTRMIQLGSFFNRFEAIFQFIWSILMFLYCSIYMFSLCLVWQTTFGLKSLKPLILPITIIVASSSLLPDSMMQVMNANKLIDNITYPLVFLIPFVVGLIDKKKNGE